MSENRKFLKVIIEEHDRHMPYKHPSDCGYSVGAETKLREVTTFTVGSGNVSEREIKKLIKHLMDVGHKWNRNEGVFGWAGHLETNSADELYNSVDGSNRHRVDSLLDSLTALINSDKQGRKSRW